jgi:8-oxo-dGTP pyrophosphatase MutT (NUDIX family)
MTYIPYLIPVSIKGIVFEEAKVWLRKNEREEWELPGGKLDPGEQPIQTVIRELQEELGFETEVAGIVQAQMYTIHTSSDEHRGVLVVSYACRLLAKTGDFEHIGEAGKAEFKAWPLSEVESLNMPEFYKEAIKSAAVVLN